ncbi:MAG: serine hydrolase domain-containing protein [Croceibacterium sp.]
MVCSPRFAAFLLALSISTASPAIAQEVAPPATQSVDAGSNAALLVPEGWAVVRNRGTVVITAPEGDATVALVPITTAANGEEAVAQAWAQFDPAFDRTVRLAVDQPDREGWTNTKVVNYETSPAEKLVLQGIGLKSADGWTAVLIRGAQATFAKRGGQLGQMFGSLRPKTYAKESFAGKTAHKLDDLRILQIKDFVATSMDQLGIPGAGLALIQDGRIVWEGGVGVKEAGTTELVDANTQFMIASNTKGMATLLLSTLVDEGRLKWDQPVTEVYPDFRLGSDETTSKTLVRHLVCACTGLPRKDMEWIFNTRPDTPALNAFEQLAATEPTSGFGEVFQYNNLMASAAGYVGAHIIHPDMELGAAFKRAMKERIFDPLGMARTTFETAEVMKGNWARPHAFDVENRIAPAAMDLNLAMEPFLPAGGAWSSAHDMALYVLNELEEGALPSGGRLVSAENLLARRAHNVPTGEATWYGMGLFDDRTYGVSVVQHGGSLVGYKSNWFAVPAADAAVVILTNSDAGQSLLGTLSRRFLEVLYDGKPEAVETVASIVETREVAYQKFRSEIDYPAKGDILAGLADRYTSRDLGPLTVKRENGRTYLQSTTIRSEVTTRKNEDGTYSAVMISPGLGGFGILTGNKDGKRTLTLNDRQHEYVWVEA